MNPHSPFRLGADVHTLRPPLRKPVRSGLVAGLLAAPMLVAGQLSSAPNPFIEEQRQQERERALRDQQERSVDARLSRPPAEELRRLPDGETPCFRIDRVVLSGESVEDFQWALGAMAGADGDDSPLGRCLGAEGINIILARLQQAVIARGYVTTRVLVGSQDLTQGTLTLTLVPGRIAAIRFEGDVAPTSLRTAIPARVGDLLNLRDIEQGLENLKRVPTAEADIRGWALGLAYREFIGAATLDANLAYRRGTGAFGAIPAPEEAFDEGTSRMRIVTADVGLDLPFELGGQRLRWTKRTIPRAIKGWPTPASQD